MKIETFEGTDGWRVRLMGDNGEIIATTEAYDSHYNAQRAQKSIEAQLNATTNHEDPAAA